MELLIFVLLKIHLDKSFRIMISFPKEIGLTIMTKNQFVGCVPFIQRRIKMLLYADNIKKMEILKRKMPKVKWFGGEDVVEWHPKFPFIIYLDDNYISDSTITQANS